MTTVSVVSSDRDPLRIPGRIYFLFLSPFSRKKGLRQERKRQILREKKNMPNVFYPVILTHTQRKRKRERKREENGQINEAIRRTLSLSLSRARFNGDLARWSPPPSLPLDLFGIFMWRLFKQGVTTADIQISRQAGNPLAAETPCSCVDTFPLSWCNQRSKNFFSANWTGCCCCCCTGPLGLGPALIGSCIGHIWTPDISQHDKPSSKT